MIKMLFIVRVPRPGLEINVQYSTWVFRANNHVDGTRIDRTDGLRVGGFTSNDTALYSVSTFLAAPA